MGISISPDGIGMLLEQSRELAAKQVEEEPRVNPVHEKVFLLLAAGMRVGEVAETVGASEATVRQWKNSQYGRKRIAELVTEIVKATTADVGKVIRASAMEAVEVILDIMRNGENEAVKLKAAIEMKDTAGFKPRETVLTANYNITAEVADRIRQGLRESIGEVEELPPLEGSATALLAAAGQDSAAPDHVGREIDPGRTG